MKLFLIILNLLICVVLISLFYKEGVQYDRNGILLMILMIGTSLLNIWFLTKEGRDYFTTYLERKTEEERQKIQNLKSK